MSRISLTLEYQNPIDEPSDTEGMAEHIEGLVPCIYNGNRDGYYGLVDGEGFNWKIEEVAQGVEIDPRQREASALLLMAFNLPQQASQFAASMIEASAVFPGMHTGHMPVNHTRMRCLARVYQLVGDMIEEEAEKGRSSCS